MDDCKERKVLMLGLYTAPARLKHPLHLNRQRLTIMADLSRCATIAVDVSTFFLLALFPCSSPPMHRSVRCRLPDDLTWGV